MAQNCTLDLRPLPHTPARLPASLGSVWSCTLALTVSSDKGHESISGGKSRFTPLTGSTFEATAKLSIAVFPLTGWESPGGHFRRKHLKTRQRIFSEANVPGIYSSGHHGHWPQECQLQILCSLIREFLSSGQYIKSKGRTQNSTVNLINHLQLRSDFKTAQGHCQSSVDLRELSLRCFKLFCGWEGFLKNRQRPVCLSHCGLGILGLPWASLVMVVATTNTEVL